MTVPGKEGWRLFELPDHGLILVKDFVLRTDEVNRSRVAVGVRGNGVYIFAEPLVKHAPPDPEQLLVVFSPAQLQEGEPLRHFTPFERAEIRDAYLLNRQQLLHLVEVKDERGR